MLRDKFAFLTRRNLFILVVVVIVVIALVFATANVYLRTNNTAPKTPVTSQSTSTNTSNSSLGEPLWKDGVSSYLFGSNNTEDYTYDSFLSDPQHVIQPTLKENHFTLMRSFFFHYTIYGDQNDHRTTIGTHPQNTQTFSLSQYAEPAPQAQQLPGSFYEIEQRVQAIENAGMTCLGVLPGITTDPAHPNDGNPKHNFIDPVTGKIETDLDFDKKIVAYLGNRCNLYEFGNEPDYNGISLSMYEARWDEFIPQLKALNPQAKFIGPVTASYQGLSQCTYAVGQDAMCFMNTFLKDVASGKVSPAPDAISFHNYADNTCDSGTQAGSACLTQAAAELTTNIQQVRTWMTTYLGRQLPLGITEWNANPDTPKYMVTDTSLASQFAVNMLQAMIANKLDFANEFDAQDGSGGCYLDMFNSCTGTDQPTGLFTGIASVIHQYYRASP